MFKANRFVLNWKTVDGMELSDPISTGLRGQTHTFNIITVDGLFWPAVNAETIGGDGIILSTQYQHTIPQKSLDHAKGWCEHFHACSVEERSGYRWLPFTQRFDFDY